MKYAEIIAEREALVEKWKREEIEKAFTKKLRVYAFEKSKGLCWYCGIPLTRGGAGPYKTLFAMDHQTPKSNGGAHSEENTVAACFSCNSKKGARKLDEYRAFITDRTGEIPVFFMERKP